MAGVDLGKARPVRDDKPKSRRRIKRRTGVRVVMTPMVDIAFLLLIFYMVTTIFAMPQAMGVNLPPDEVVTVGKLLTIRVDGQNRFYWNLGHDLPVPMRADSLFTLLFDKSREIPKLNTLLTIHPQARYHVMVDILDEIDLVERKFNDGVAARLGVSAEIFNDPDNDRYSEFYDKRFSYRYATAPWEDRDTRIINKIWRTGRGGIAMNNKTAIIFDDEFP